MQFNDLYLLITQIVKLKTNYFGIMIGELNVLKNLINFKLVFNLH